MEPSSYIAHKTDAGDGEIGQIDTQKQGDALQKERVGRNRHAGHHHKAFSGEEHHFAADHDGKQGGAEVICRELSQNQSADGVLF